MNINTNSTIFYHDASDLVKNEIRNREGIYTAPRRAGMYYKDKHNSFLAGKTAFAKVSTNNLTLGNLLAGFSISRKDEFPQYQGMDSKGNVNDNGTIIPKPGLISVNVRHDGELGTLQRVTVVFKVFSLEQLDTYEKEFLVVGNDVTIEYGWTVSGEKDINTNTKANTGIFTGKTYNFSYSLNNEGGFDCQFDAVGEGYFPLGVDPTKNSDAASIYLSSAGPVNKETGGIMSELEALRAKSFNNLNEVHGTYIDGIAQFQTNFISNPINLETSEILEGTSGGTVSYYVTLEKLVNLVNKLLGTKLKNGIEIICNDNITVGHYNWWLKSANPNQCLFPDKNQGDYSMVGAFDKAQELGVPGGSWAKFSANVQHGAQDPSYSRYKNAIASESEFLSFNVEELNWVKTTQQETSVYLGNILINIDLLKELSIPNNSDELTYRAFFKKIFDIIRWVSGDIYDLILYIPEEDNKNILILNKNWTSGKVKPVIFKPFGLGSVVRNMTLTAEIPDALATEAYVAARAPDKSSSTKYPRFVTNAITSKQLRDKNEKMKPDEIALILTSLDYAYTVMSRTTQEIKKLVENTNDHELARKSLLTFKSSWPFNNQLMLWNNNILLPLKLSVTIDGINGFKFGDVIGTKYLPKKYRTENNGLRVVFSVTKVNHDISNNDWSTTLETVCRISESTNVIWSK